ncbi:MAG: InlB B-repeat-containing protein [Alphaproteobacteria bacterium]|nr:InlB B-repeat-containing protein [Alphaproteobacteria bacterium]
MKKFIVLLLILLCTVTYADNVNIYWKVGDSTYATTQCEMGNDLILPTTPTKTGYTFRGWRIAQYIPIEYLESTGGAFINTNFIPLTTKNLRINISFIFSNIISNEINGIWGYMNTSTIPRFGLFYNPGWTGFGSGVNETVYWDKSASIGVLYTAQLYNGVFTLSDNNTSKQINIGTYNTNQNTYPIYLGARCNENAVPLWPSNIKIYYFQIWQDDVLVRDFIPVLDHDGVPCMYDKVEGKFYYNQGTGQFIDGPIINE